MPASIVSESEGARSRKGGAQGFRGLVCELARAIELSAMARQCEELLVEKENHKACDQVALLHGCKIC